MNKEDRRRVAKIRSEKNEELRKNAPIPKDKNGYRHDIKGVRFENIHNSVTMQIVSSWVSDKGIVLWTSDAGDIYTTRDIKEHWTMLSEEPQGW